MRERIPANVAVGIRPSDQPNRVALQVPSRARVISAVVVVD